MNKDLKTYYKQAIKDAEQITSEMGYPLEDNRTIHLVSALLPLIARHSYYAEKDIIANAKDVDFKGAGP